MPRFLTPIIAKDELITGNEIISGNQTILGVTSGKDSYWTTVNVQNGLSADYATFTYNISGLYFYSNGIKLIDDNDYRLNLLSSNSANWESVYNNVSSNSADYVTLNNTQILKNKTVIDWMTLVRGYNTTPVLLSSIPTGEVYLYVYNSIPSNITYYRFISNDGNTDIFYTYFSGNILSGMVASKSITI